MTVFRADQSRVSPLGISLDPDSTMTLFQQCVEGIRTAIRSGRVAGGMRLPPSRELAKELGVSRSVIVAAYEQLEAEGYLEGRIGSGTYVVGNSVFDARRDPIEGNRARQSLAGRHSFFRMRASGDIVDFEGATASHELEKFPRSEWSRCLSLASREASSGYAFGEAAGSRSLRRAVADYLFRMKGMASSEDEIIITSGSSQAALLIGAYLRGLYSEIQVEDPTYPPLRATFKRLGLRPRPIPVDDSGLVPDSVDGRLPLIITPAHHFPTGALLPAERREVLAAKIRSGQALIVEDDYDGELRLRGLPVKPLRAIEPERAILVGSFSKVMYPGLRLGYISAPERIVDRLLGLKFALALWADGLTQAALARFIDEGRLDKRVRRIKRDCAVKRELVEKLASDLPRGGGRILGEACGMHCSLVFPGGLPRKFARTETTSWGFIASRSTSFSILPELSSNDSLLIGYGALSEDRLRSGFARMAAYIEGRSG